MAEKRMFAKSIVLSDAFLDMPMSARCLYFTLGMVAYNKGIVVGARTMAAATGCGEDDIKTLVERGYIKPIEDGLFKIVHWYENNNSGTVKARNTYAYRKWREEIIERDKKCVWCGSTDKLEVHHIKPFAEYPELRYDYENAITLCEQCHKRYHGLEKKDGKEKNV